MEYKKIAKMRLSYISRSPPNPSHFTVLVRAIPRSAEESFSDAVQTFFMKYHGSSYLSHQIIYRCGKVQKLVNKAEKIYNKFVDLKVTTTCHASVSSRIRCGLCGGTSESFKIYHSVNEDKKRDLDQLDSNIKPKECGAAFVFFKTRYAAVVASHVLQSSNPMAWVTDLAPEPHDVYWSNLWIPYRQLWLRRIATLLAAIFFMLLFIIPVTFVQGLSQLEQLQQMFPFLKSILNNQINVISSPKGIPTQLAKAVPRQILNVYCSKYETGGQFWPIMHNTTIFSLVLTQIIALGVFGLKDSPVASGFTIPLVILTLLFNEYCRKRFYPVFKNFSAED
ncbi:hypothetical protein QJS04_geneDACA022098 [Acorus gramineus]|uniref:CSC1-like protein RXW8 n=1 Tax=Acorus gramineus TaxID=55184 RepID=A0AAV9B0I9_ACOGR|nr:hypothetical protein QJS04_geneDACA022098 [Acorus gramineus]